jgi:hypothetical protein
LELPSKLPSLKEQEAKARLLHRLAKTVQSDLMYKAEKNGRRCNEKRRVGHGQLRLRRTIN